MEARVLTEDELDSAYDVVSVPERAGKKWRLYNGETNIDAIMEDADFQRMFDEHNISVEKDDIMICDIDYHYEEPGFKKEYTIVKVFEIATLAKEELG